MLVLGLDSSTDFLSAAICGHGSAPAEITFEAGRRHAEQIVTTIDRLLHENGLVLADLDLLAVSQGPGSFTGVRIGVAALKGLALGADKPLVGVSTLRALARAARVDAERVCVLLDARMNEVFCGSFRREGAAWIETSPERAGPIESFAELFTADTMLIGDGAHRYAERLRAVAPQARVLPPAACRPSGAAVAEEGLAALRAGDLADAARVQPVYLRQSQPEEIRRRRLEAQAPV